MRTFDYFLRSAELNPDRMALVDGAQRLSYSNVAECTKRIAKAMWAGGLERQSKVALYAPNGADVMLCLLSLWRAGAVWIPVNTRNAVEANIAYLNYVRAEWLFYHSSYSADVLQFKVAVPTLRHFICLDRENDSDVALARFVDAEAAGDEPDWADPFGNLADLVGIFPTGGTTGPSKGVRVTNLGWGTMIETAMTAWRGRTSEPVCLTTAPITHAAGPVAIAAMALGATIVILPGFDALGVLQAIEVHRVTHMFLPPTALYSLLAHPRLGAFDYTSLRVFLLAGSPVSPEKLKLAVKIFGPCICQSYGQTESPMLVTWLSPEEVAEAANGIAPEHLRSCGKPTQSVRVGIMDDAGNLLRTRDVGEIVVRGALVSDSYFELPEATAEVRTYGWHHTGDVGYRDEAGYIYIVDRKKDMIITGGFNVFCAEVEAAVMELSAVRECAVIGVPDEKWGEAVTAIVGLNDGMKIDQESIIAHCKARLGGVKAPKAVHVWVEVPRTPAGKFDKQAIRSRFWSGTERNVH
jgi:acyl-CoA synthetase (AMP-forming)/AMP-acid ligase II